MKKIILFFLIVCFVHIAIAQSYSLTTLYKNQSFQLNSGGRALLGGVSRTYLPVQVPLGAVAIVYTVKSSLNYDGGQNIQLATELAASLSGHPEISTAIRMIKMPPSNAVIDVYILSNDQNNLMNFLNKKDSQWVQYTNYACLSSLGCQRAISVSSDMQTMYIALKNPSSLNRIVAIVDVVAVIPN